MLHFNEQFRQLDEISDDSEKLPPTVKLNLLQTAVRSVNDLRIAETLDEFQSATQGHGFSTSLSHKTYDDLLINVCVRYDKTKKAKIGKRRNIYNSNIDSTYDDYPPDIPDFVPDSPYGVYTSLLMSSIISMPFPLGIQLFPGLSTPPNHHLGPNLNKSPSIGDGPIYLPPQIFKLLSQDAMKVLKAYNTETINRFHQRKVHNTEVVAISPDDPPEPSVPDSGLSDLPESDPAIPDDPILDFGSSQSEL